MKLSAITELRDAGLVTLAHLAMLMAVDERMPIGEAAERCDMKFSTASRIAQSLVDAGYLSAAPSKKDRRVRLVERTTKAAKLFSTE